MCSTAVLLPQPNSPISAEASRASCRIMETVKSFMLAELLLPLLLVESVDLLMIQVLFSSTFIEEALPVLSTRELQAFDLFAHK